jgi:hypothetical protein
MEGKSVANEEIKQRLVEIVLANTLPHSRHQAEAINMLETHCQRFKAELKNIRCVKCRQIIECVRWTDKGVIVDSWGYIEDANGKGDECHRCLDEGYIGDIFLPAMRTVRGK